MQSEMRIIDVQELKRAYENEVEIILPDGSIGMHVRQDETDFHFTFYQKGASGVWAKQGEMVLSKDLKQFPTVREGQVVIDNFERAEEGPHPSILPIT